MRSFYFTRYRFYQKHLKHSVRLFLLSDLHFSYKLHNDRLQAIAERVKRSKPDYICIPGDLVDSHDMIDDQTERQRLYTWLEQIGKIAPVIISLGNHDFYRKGPGFGKLKGERWLIEDDHELFAELNQIPNVHLLNNGIYKDSRVYIFGFTQSPEYFNFSQPKNTRKNGEIKSCMIHDLDQVPRRRLHRLPKHKAKIALVHSPIYLKDPEIAPYFADFDFTISGHMHNGCVPPVLNEIWDDNHGIISPSKRLFPKLARTRNKSQFNKNIVLGSVVTIQECSKPLTPLNAFFPVNLATLDILKKSGAHKPDISFKYENF